MVQTRRPQPIAGLGESGRGVDHGLFVAKEVVAEVRILLQRLSDARDVSMAEDSQTSLKEPVFRAVAFGVLVLEERDDGLRHGQTSGHVATLSRNDSGCQAFPGGVFPADKKADDKWGAETRP